MFDMLHPMIDYLGSDLRMVHPLVTRIVTVFEAFTLVVQTPVLPFLAINFHGLTTSSS